MKMFVLMMMIVRTEAMEAQGSPGSIGAEIGTGLEEWMETRV